MADAYRCSRCSIDWPNDHSAYQKCHKCGEKTDMIGSGKPLSAAEALSLKNHLDFDRFLEEQWEPNRATREMAGFESAFEAAPSIPDPS